MKPHLIKARENLDFKLTSDIPKYWFGGEMFKTRLFDALSLLFPEGERFFITSVRNFKDQIKDPHLLQEVDGFVRQEAQHGIAHRQNNLRLTKHGVEAERLELELRDFLTKTVPRFSTMRSRLAVTAAMEHITAILCLGMLQNREFMEKADPRIKALFTWHSIEELEHKAVTYDVMKNVAGVGYVRRLWGMIHASVFLTGYSLYLTNCLLKVDGGSFMSRIGAWVKGLVWMYGPRGLLMPCFWNYVMYFRPGFHPRDIKEPLTPEVWRKAMSEGRGDPIEAAKKLSQRVVEV